jgi:hypothetical protein
MDMYGPDQMSCGRESCETAILTGREDGLRDVDATERSDESVDEEKAALMNPLS